MSVPDICPPHAGRGEATPPPWAVHSGSLSTYSAVPKEGSASQDLCLKLIGAVGQGAVALAFSSGERRRHLRDNSPEPDTGGDGQSQTHREPPSTAGDSSCGGDGREVASLCCLWWGLGASDGPVAATGQGSEEHKLFSL